MVGENPASEWLLQMGSPLSSVDEQARLSEEVRGHASRQRIHGSGEPHGEIAERGDHNRGILRKRLHPGN